MSKAIGYRRVSTTDQNTTRQLEGVTLDKAFEDKLSGAKTDNRPQLQACLEYLRDGDTLHVHSIDRLARNLLELQKLVEDLTERGVSVRFHKEGLTFTGASDPMQMLMFQMMGAFAQFERSLIRERQREGIQAAKAKGKHLGRKPILTPEQVKEARQRREAGESAAALAKDYGVSRATMYQHLAGTTE
ncbi:recombinase family protein [Thiorhodococcus minor]|uniref:Recombinase family protein n=1 Tax=Thiorhodococcus minor TaxID=57489 RepID=A0A6M0K7H9_9GAMM|nr:recombinase family protein [Thiorhodococcus minor]NEV65264.1 recombinase family protein [Thiorhodococcus minor]